MEPQACAVGAAADLALDLYGRAFAQANWLGLVTEADASNFSRVRTLARRCDAATSPRVRARYERRVVGRLFRLAGDFAERARPHRALSQAVARAELDSRDRRSGWTEAVWTEPACADQEDNDRIIGAYDGACEWTRRRAGEARRRLRSADAKRLRSRQAPRPRRIDRPCGRPRGRRSRSRVRNRGPDDDGAGEPPPALAGSARRRARLALRSRAGRRRP
jgi:hypothetical protein